MFVVCSLHILFYVSNCECVSNKGKVPKEVVTIKSFVMRNDETRQIHDVKKMVNIVLE